jgi:hypothetical protein
MNIRKYNILNWKKNSHEISTQTEISEEDPLNIQPLTPVAVALDHSFFMFDPEFDGYNLLSL